MYDEILEIIPLEEMELIDIETDGDHLFYANGILTHNSSAASTDPNMDGVAESFSSMFTCDFALAIVAPQELKEKDQILGKQLKNRFSDMNLKGKFLIGFNRQKMQFYDVTDSETIEEEEPLYDKIQSAKPAKSFNGFNF